MSWWLPSPSFSVCFTKMCLGPWNNPSPPHPMFKTCEVCHACLETDTSDGDLEAWLKPSFNYNQQKKRCLGRETKTFWNQFLTIQLPRESPACLSGLPCLNLLLMTPCKSDLQGYCQPGCSEQLALLLPVVIFFTLMFPRSPLATLLPSPA